MNIPWVEKYRPDNFDDIVLDKYNKIILKNIVDKSYFPNLLLYGPPGTGKTTTMINLIKEYEQKIGKKISMIHLNASDERGIDIIRNQIFSFVSAKSIFHSEIKFVILDEVDYMTKNAQSALKYLLQCNNNVCFCLICNYISKIDESLQNEFVKLRFNQLPDNLIFNFLKKITEKENIQIHDGKIKTLQKNFNSDIRSMINYMQTNQDDLGSEEKNIMNNELWEKLFLSLCTQTEKQNAILINNTIKMYNIEFKNLLKIFLNYIIRNYQVDKTFLNFCENIVHNTDADENISINYFLSKNELFKSLNKFT